MFSHDIKYFYDIFNDFIVFHFKFLIITQSYCFQFLFFSNICDVHFSLKCKKLISKIVYRGYNQLNNFKINVIGRNMCCLNLHIFDHCRTPHMSIKLVFKCLCLSVHFCGFPLLIFLPI